MKFVIFFLISFLIIFAVLNGRFLYENVRFWAAGVKLIAPTGKLVPSTKTLGSLPDSATLVIEKTGTRAPIIFGVADDQKKIYDSLQNGVVNYPGSPKPGTKGISIILGHSSAYPWYKGNYGSVFALLGKLQPGDQFYIQYTDGQKFVYSVKQIIIFAPFASNPRLSDIEKSSENSVVLVSCWPLGTNYKRIAVYAEAL